ncbi:MAG: aminopeptidase P family protein [Anaerolineae bacterium]|nr:aminopeptidase P family protein [Anaerolineae bacterium]
MSGKSSAEVEKELFPIILPLRQRADVIHRILKKRLDTILPVAMREAGLDMWLILCQEDNLDPVFTTLIPPDTWCPILQILVFYDRGGERGVERINLSGTNTHDLYDRPYKGQVEREQWPLLRQIIAERDPQRIGLNIGSVAWAAGGLTHNLYTQLVQQLPPKYVERLVSAEPVATRWLATLTDDELGVYEHVVQVAHALIAECFSRRAIVPHVTTTPDLEWHYWQRAADLGLEVSFKPYFSIIRSNEMKATYGSDDRVIRPGDLIHCDVGIRYLRLNSDHQQLAYVRRPGELAAPTGLQKLMAEATRLQDIFMAEFREGLTGNQLLKNILTRARNEGVPNPRVYSHSLGLFLHEPGPLIGLPWEQESCPGRGDVVLNHNYAFTMELSVTGPVPEWDSQEVRLGREEDVAFTPRGCYPLDGRQTVFHII